MVQGHFYSRMMSLEGCGKKKKKTFELPERQNNVSSSPHTTSSSSPGLRCISQSPPVSGGIKLMGGWEDGGWGGGVSPPLVSG